jgi:hypothetical protein
MQACFTGQEPIVFFSSNAVSKTFRRISRWALVALMLTLSSHAFAMTQCSDGIDNDGDGFIDLQDFNCVDSDDDSERPTQCSDGIDNDGDGFTDLDDFNCVDGEDETERPTECSDGIDNDGDGFTDLDDFNCVDGEDETERPTQCSDGIDNDGDGFTDLDDFDCESAEDRVEGSGLARFEVTKTFSNGATGDVEVTLTCNGGTPLQQSFTISGGSPGVTFTVTALPDEGADCAVSESGRAGYTADLGACAWTGVTDGYFTCLITNVPVATAVTVETLIDTGDPAIDDSFVTTISCDSVNPTIDSNFIAVTVTDSTGLFEADWYADPDGGTDCTVSTVFASSAIEAAPCSFSFDVGDETSGCAVQGTVFFEGIPVLDRYGLALMALLMLGIGFVGMRRLV